MLASVSIGALGLAVIAITTDGHLSMWCLIAVGLCHSIMFPTIFTLGIRGLGPLTEEGSGLLIMAIEGGALSALQGVIAVAGCAVRVVDGRRGCVSKASSLRLVRFSRKHRNEPPAGGVAPAFDKQRYIGAFFRHAIRKNTDLRISADYHII
jgi:hypothetical protein